MFDLVKIPRAGHCPVCDRDVKWLATFDVSAAIVACAWCGGTGVETYIGRDGDERYKDCACSAARISVCADCLRRKANEIFVKASSTNVSETYDGESTRYAEPLIGDSQR